MLIPHVNTSPAPAVVTSNSSLPLHVYDVPASAKLLCHVCKVSPPILLSANLTTTPTSHVPIKKFPHFCKQLMISPRKPVFYNYNYKCKGVSLQASFSMLITLLFHVILNFQSTKMILAFNIFRIFNLITLTYMKCYNNFGRSLTNYMNRHKYFLSWFFNCFYPRQVIKIAWVMNGKNFTSATKFIFLIGLISANCLQSTKSKVKCYRYFINSKFSEFIRKTYDEYPSARISKPKQFNVFKILTLFMIGDIAFIFF